MGIKIMDIIKRIETLIESTTTGDIETNDAKGHVPLMGMRYKKKKKRSKLTGKAYTVHERMVKKNE